MRPSSRGRGVWYPANATLVDHPQVTRRKFRECSPPSPFHATLAPFRLWLHGAPGAGREFRELLPHVPGEGSMLANGRRLYRPCRNRYAGTPDSATVAATVRSEYWGMGAISCRLMSERVERTRGRRARDTSFPEQCKEQRFANTLAGSHVRRRRRVSRNSENLFGPSFPKGRRLASASGWRQGRRQARHHSGERSAEARALIHRNGRRAP